MFSRIPSLVFLCFLACGILSSRLSLFGLSGWSFYMLSIVFFVCMVILGLRVAFRGLWWKVSLYASFFLAGFTSAKFVQDEFSRSISLEKEKYEGYRIVLRSVPEKRPAAVRYEARVVALYVSGNWKPIDPVKCLVSIADVGEFLPLAGAHLVVKGRLRRPARPMNPGNFDYARYLEQKGIAWTAYIRWEQIISYTTPGSGWDPVLASCRFSAYTDSVYKKYLADPDAYGLIKAMILGRRDDLSEEINDAYVSSGTVHILSVSGLHISIFFMVISRLFGFLRRGARGKYLYLALLAALIAFYSLMTGLPPSVFRASLMCIIWLLADVFSRRNSLANTLGLSALIILTFDPYALFDVGFQLSYLAMAGIIMFSQYFENALKSRYILLQKVWQLTAVSFAAQLTTFPLSVYYFHQFPFYFWLINPLVIDISAILLPLSFFLPLTDAVIWSPAAGLMGWVIELLSRITNWIVDIPRFLPAYLLENLNLNLAAVFMIYLQILLVFFLLRNRQIVLVRYLFYVSSFYALTSVMAMCRAYKDRYYFVYAMKEHDVLGFKSGTKMYLLGDSVFFADRKAYTYQLKGWVIDRHLDTITVSSRQRASFRDLEVRVVGDNCIVAYGEELFLLGYMEAHGVVQPDIHLVTDESYFLHGTYLRKGSVVMAGHKMRSKAYTAFKTAMEYENAVFHDLRQLGAYPSVSTEF